MRALAVWAALLTTSAGGAQWGGELRLCLHSEPRTLDPLQVDDDASETVRYLTGGVLVRVNRLTQELEPELARSWTVESGGRTIRFQLREGVVFSDGTPFTADDVAYTIERLLAPELHSVTGDAFRSGAGEVRTKVSGPYRVEVTFPTPVPGVARLFDQVAILSRRSPLKLGAVLGAFRVAEHRPGTYLLLARNPNYWKTVNGRRLPYLDALRLEIQSNRELELMRFRKGEIDLLQSVEPDRFEQLAPTGMVRDAGGTLEGELLWFNQNPTAPIPEYRRQWFQSSRFRRAISHAIRRDDLCRVVFRGHAQPGVGPFAPANRFWFNAKLRPPAFDLELARGLLAAEGFRATGGQLCDRDGHPVEFSVVTNSGNRTRERAAAMIQQDLAALGIRLNLVTLDFPSLIERITRSFQYESCLLGMINIDLDPQGQMSVWHSASASHQWYPNQKSPATQWEAEIDRLMLAQASTLDYAKRKALFDRVQEIAWEEAPMLYLAYRHALVGASPAVRDFAPSVLRPQALWNAERLWLDRGKRAP